MRIRSYKSLALASERRTQPWETGLTPSGVSRGRPFWRGIPWKPTPPRNLTMWLMETEGLSRANAIWDFEYTVNFPVGVGVFEAPVEAFHLATWIPVAS